LFLIIVLCYNKKSFITLNTVAKASKDVKSPVKKTRKKTSVSVRANKIKPTKNNQSVGRFLASAETDFLINDKKIAIGGKNRQVSVIVAKNPLDSYRSPYLLDLSQAKFIERVRPSLSGIEGNYYDQLPAADILSKFYIFELVAFEKSEFINFLKLISAKVTYWKRKFWGRVDLSPNLPLIRGKKTSKTLSRWQEVSVINLLIFVGNFFYQIILFSGELLYEWAGKIGFINHDEVIDFDYRPKAAVSQAIVDFRIGQIERTSLAKVKPVQPVVDFNNSGPAGLFWKPLAVFVGLCLIIALPIKSFDYWQEIKLAKGAVLGQAEEALSNLDLASEQLKFFNFSSAKEHLAAANQNFVSAQEQLTDIESFLTVIAETLPLGNTFKSGKNMLDLGDHLSLAGENLLVGLETINADTDSSLTGKIKSFGQYSQVALRELELAEDKLTKIKMSNLPLDKQAQFTVLAEKLPLFINSLRQLNSAIDFAVNFLGDNQLRRYLFVFQNDNELRATGGFMGSFALIDFKSGNIDKIDIPAGGTYDVRAGMKELVQSPQPLQLINPRWEFQDANWWPDWPRSAEKIAWFYNKSGGPTIDGVIAVNSDWLSQLLTVIGDIDLPEYQKKITAANFEMEIQKEVEIEYDSEHQPKKILGDLAPKLLTEVFDAEPDEFLNLLAAIEQGLTAKDILIYSFDDELQNFIASNNWHGGMKDTDKDYFSLVSTNIGGGKTDNIIKQQIYHQAQIMVDGSVIDSVIVRRSHLGPIDENFTNYPSRSYLRFYVPAGSQLIKAIGFSQPKETDFKEVDYPLMVDEGLLNENSAEIDPDSQTRIYREGNKTVFGNWQILAPGQSGDLLLVYKLPFKLNLAAETAKQTANKGWGRFLAAFMPQRQYDSYSLVVQKQPGGDGEFSTSITYPETVTKQVVYPTVPAESNKIYFYDQLDQDKFYFIGLASSQ